MPALVAPAVLLALVVAGAAIEAQDAAPAFEVASIKPRTGEPAFAGPSSPDRFVNPDATLAALVRYAYNVQDFQVIGGPEWTRSRRFDVSAKAQGRPSQAEMQAMMRSLLAERFGLTMHTETREMPTYALVKARDEGQLGERMRPSDIDCQAILAAGETPALPSAAGPAGRCAWRIGITAVTSTMILNGVPMSQLATVLQSLVRRRVVDETGLAGTFDVRMEFTSEQMPFTVPLPRDAAAGPPRDGLSVFTALEEQLGLKLESRRGAVPVVVIDSAEPPTAD